MQRDLDKLSNQARFVKMIIDGKLVVSKKKKQVLVDELKKQGFKQFPKISDAAKAGEKEKTLEGKAADDNSEDEADSPETRRDASAYDYLLGMAIWSLTEERVAKLLRQIGDKEVEIDDLIKLTPKDLWTKDLDDFIAEWHFQLLDAKNRTRKARAAGRRRSAKLGLDAKGGNKRKRKGDDEDDDFQVGKKKPAVKSVIDRVKSKQPSALMSYFSKPSDSSSSVPPAKAGADDDDFMDIDQIPDTKKEEDDDFGPPLVAVKKRGRTNGVKPKAAPKAPKIEKIEVSDDDDVDNMFAAVQAQAAARKASDPPVRNARAAAKKKNYVLSDTSSDSDASNGDDLLGDVSMMVKGIGAAAGTSSGEKSARPLFTQTTARPSSSHGLPRSISKAKQTVVGAIDLDDSDGIDETDYKSLIPVGSPMRPAARRAGDARGLDEEDDEADSFNMPPPKTKALAKKPSVIGQAKIAKAAKQAPAAAPKKMALSPAARAYAAKQAKAAAAQEAAEKPAAKKKAAAPALKKAAKKAAALSDDEVMGDDDDLANEILSDKETPPVRNRGRRVVAATKKYAFSDDDDEDEESEEEESFDAGDESD